jgi:hypothetical protein
MAKLRIALTSLFVFLGLVAADVNFNESRAVLKAVASSSSLVSPTISNPTITGTVSGNPAGIQTKLAQWAVPCIKAPSGSMANNGAVSGMTAFQTTYAGGAWLYLPANAIQAGSAEGYYWFIASSTTAGTVYNSTWDGTGTPTIGTATAFVSTGPGAFTGVITTEIPCGSVTIPANTMGASGQILIDFSLSNNTAANNKNFRIKLGGTEVALLGASTALAGMGRAVIANAGVTNRQKTGAFAAAGTAILGNNPALVYTSLDTTGALTLSFTMAVLTTATNYGVLEGVSVFLAP